MSAERYLLLVAVGVWVGVLSWQDWRTRRLSNWLTLGGAVVALVFRLGYGGVTLLVDGFAAAVVAGGFLLLPFLVRGAGGGDVKMLFAAGAVAGWVRLFPLLWLTSLAGVVFGVALLLWGVLDGARLRHYMRVCFDWRYDRAAGVAVLPAADEARFRIPFSIPIAVGLLLALWRS